MLYLDQQLRASAAPTLVFMLDTRRGMAIVLLEIFLNRGKISLNSANSENLIITEACLYGTVVASWSLTPEMAGSSPFTLMTNIFCR